MTFKAAAAIRWQRIHGDEEWSECECGCGRAIQRGTVPHHIGPARGMGGRKHDPNLLRFLSDTCHDAAHGIKRRE